MTEAEWLASTSPYDMLVALSDRARADERKLRLFGVACCRRHWDPLLAFDFADNINSAEDFVEGRISQDELQARYDGFMATSGPALEASIGAVGWTMLVQPFDDTQAEITCDALVDLVLYAAGLRNDSPEWNEAVRAENRGQASVLREIFGNPFRRPRVLRAWLAWRDRTVPRLARAAYEERALPSGHLDNHRLAILADALEEAGCTNQEVLSHLRGPAPHVRGCWALDLILGKK